MLKFFRTLRRNLISEGNFKKYLIYAIGEILLVMIGILLALQVNNWNNKKLDKKAEIQVYQNIKRQITDDKNVINGVIGYNNQYLDQFEFANRLIRENDRSRLDSMANILINLTKNSDFNRSSNIYQTILNSGELKLIQNQIIIEQLQGLEETYIYINRLENSQFQVILQFVAPEIMSKINLSQRSIEKVEAIYSFEFQNLMISIIRMMKEKNQIYQRALNEITTLTESINSELN